MLTEAIIIKKVPRREHDQLVVLYSHEYGKLAVVAKGSMRGSSRQRPSLDEGNIIRGELVPSRAGMSILTAAQAQTCWRSLKASPAAWAAAQFFLEAVDALVYDSQPDGALWDALTGALAALDAATDIPAEFRRQQGILLDALGYGRAQVPIDEEFERIAGRAFRSLNLFYGLIGTQHPWYGRHHAG